MTKMSDEETEQQAKLERLRAIRRGSRGVVMKFTKQVNDILSKSEIDAEVTSQLRVIFK